MKLARIIAEKKHGVISIKADESMRDAAKKLCEQQVGSLLVTDPADQSKYVGIITESDIIRCCGTHSHKDLSLIKVGDEMTRNMVVATVEDDVSYIAGVMTRHKLGHIPVFDGRQIVGIVTMSDIIRTMNQEAETTIRHLSDYLGGTYGSDVY